MVDAGYAGVLRNIKLREVKFCGSERRQALKDQKGICAKCKKVLNPCYTKYVADATAVSGFKVLCLDCFFKK